MEEATRFDGALLCQKLGEGRKKFMVIDAGTGEKISEWFVGDVEYAFSCGVNAVALTLMVGREVTEAGREYITITDYNQEPPKVLYSFWNEKRKKINKKPKHTGGKKSYVKIFSEKMASIGSEEAGSLMLLSSYVDWESGALLNKRTKKPLKFVDTLRIVGCVRATWAKRLQRLRDAGAIFTDNDGRYILSRDFIRKG